MENIQNFSKGLNSDLSPVYQPEGTYVDALNIELIDDESQGSVAISNSKGNKFQISIPDVDNIYKLTIIEDTFPSSGSSITIDLGIIPPVVSASNFIPTITSTPQDLYNFIINDTNLGPLVDVYIKLYYSLTSVIISPIIPNTLIVTASDSTVIAGADGIPYIPAQSNLQCIGYGIIRDNIYLFTTPCKDLDPQTNGGGYGYIWKLNYNNITFLSSDSSIELIYAGDLGFTTYYNIPQTGVVGRYENGNIQRIYWTDNYNKLRSINVADPQVFALDISLLDVVSSVDFDIPIMKSINKGGSVTMPVGCYQLAYRLKTTGSSVTSYSPLSNMVFVMTPDESLHTGGSNWRDYHGDPLGTGALKQIVWNIAHIDQDYSRIEAIILRREGKNDIPDIIQIFEGPITGESMDILVNGDIIEGPDSVSVTLDEFLALSSVFTHAKTIGTKDNRLVAGNVRVQSGLLDYDTRAYRFESSGFNFKIVEDDIINTYDITTWDTIDDKSDAVNPSNLDPLDPNYLPGYEYNINGNLGGSGPNISYEFYTVATAADKSIEIPTCSGGNPYVSTNPDYTTFELDLNVYSSDKDGNDDLQTYPITFPSPINDGIKYPQMNSIYIGYQSSEIYRFGIQFYDKTKNPYFVKWIGDIKFPNDLDPIPASNCVFEDGTLTGQSSNVKSFTLIHSANIAFVNQLGIKFDINIPANLSEKISGYSIVRVKREESDKTIIAEGIVSDWASPTGASTSETTTLVMPYGGLTQPDSVSFITPNVLDSSLTNVDAGMKIRTRSYLSYTNLNATTCPDPICGSCAPDNSYNMYKYYTQSSTPFQEYNIDFSVLMTNANTFGPNTLGFTFNNYSSGTSGNTAYWLTLDNLGFNDPLGFNDKYLCQIYRSLTNQYGGNDYTSRTNNNYILASHFRSIKTKVIDQSDSFQLFGGDVTNGIMDEQRISADWDSGAPRLSTTFFYPSSSPVNRELRYGHHVNFNLSTNNALFARDEYLYNDVYSCENDIVTFYPEPDPFISNIIYDNRFYISEIKINGELTDSWSLYKSNNYWDVEGVYGPINSMLPLSDKMYFWQDRAFGIIEINPRAIVTDNNATANNQLQVGTGLPLQRHDYLSTIVGTKHQGSTICSSYKLYWFDVNTKKLYSYSPGEGVEPMTDVKGLYAYFNKNITGEIQNIDKPTYTSIGVINPIGINGVSATFDNKRNKAIYTFHDGKNTGESTYSQESFTVVLNEQLKAFTTFHSFTPKIYINDFKYFFTTDNTSDDGLSDIYIHDIGNYGEYYDIIYDSYIKFITNPNPSYTKVFDNIVYDSQSIYNNINYNDDTWNSIRITNDYQNTDIQTLLVDSNIIRKERSWQLQIPRNRVLYSVSDSPDIYTDLSPTEKDFGERLRDKYIQVELWYENTSSKELRTNNWKTIYRQSPR